MFRHYNRKYIFPSQFAVCVVGNVLNLIVLNGRSMRTKTNCFLTAMAVADLSFFLVMLLPNLEYVGGGVWLKDVYYRNLYVFLHIPFVAFANWFSAASIWLTVAVTLDRLVATKPRRVPSMCRVWNKRRTILLIVIIYAAALILSLYHFAWRRVIKRKLSPNSTSQNRSTIGDNIVYTWSTVLEKNEPVVYWYVQSSHLLSGLLVVVGPLMLLFVLNCVIVYRLRAHNRSVGGSLFSNSNSEPGASSSIMDRIRRRERRVTLTVVLLVSVFIVFNLPSGIFSVIEFLGTKYVKVIFIKPWYWDLGEACNMLVCTGKAVNFWLYCSASSDYRRELRNVLLCRNCRVEERANSQCGDGADRSRSTSRVSASSTGLRYRRSINRPAAEIYTNCRVNGATSPV